MAEASDDILCGSQCCAGGKSRLWKDFDYAEAGSRASRREKYCVVAKTKARHETSRTNVGEGR